MGEQRGVFESLVWLLSLETIFILRKLHPSYIKFFIISFFYFFSSLPISHPGICPFFFFLRKYFLGLGVIFCGRSTTAGGKSRLSI